MIDNISDFEGTIPLMNKNTLTKRDDFSKNLIFSKRLPNKIETDRRKEFDKNIFQIFLQLKKIQNFLLFR